MMNLVVAVSALPGRIVAALGASAFGPFAVEHIGEPGQLLARLAKPGCDALLLSTDTTDDHAGIAIAAAHVALLVVMRDRSANAVLGWLRRGAQDVLGPEEVALPAFAQRVRAAIERKRLEREARMAYATDLDTGLPHQQQLIEHMSHLLALREREPSPMALLVLRVEGFATTEARLGREVAAVLRRRLAVRLRGGVRASDVVASIGADSFAVLLGSLLAPEHAQGVGAKLLQAALQPHRIAGEDVVVAIALGIGQYPQDGTQPEALLHRAIAMAASAAVQGRTGLANFNEAGGRAPAAANDD